VWLVEVPTKTEREKSTADKSGGAAAAVPDLCRTQFYYNMISFGEAVVVVTAAGMLLGRRELVAGARFLGLGFGRMVGLLQGARIKYEEKSQGTELYNLHRSVKRGLDDMGTIGTDIASIRSGNVQSNTNRFTPGAATASTHLAGAPLTTRPVNTGLFVFQGQEEINETLSLIRQEEERRLGRGNK
jgi:hypothetical protein